MDRYSGVTDCSLAPWWEYRKELSTEEFSAYGPPGGHRDALTGKEATPNREAQAQERPARCGEPPNRERSICPDQKLVHWNGLTVGAVGESTGVERREHVVGHPLYPKRAEV